MITFLIIITTLFGILGATTAILLGGVRFTKSQRNKYPLLKYLDGKQLILLFITISFLLIAYGTNASKEYLLTKYSESYNNESTNEEIYSKVLKALLIAESNILDCYYLNDRFNFEISIENQSEKIWENIWINIYIDLFAGSTPPIDAKTNNPLTKIHTEKFGYLKNGDKIKISLTENLNRHFDDINIAWNRKTKQLPSPVNMVFNPFNVLREYTNIKLTASGGQQIYDRHLDVLKQSLSFQNNLIPYLTLSPEKNRFAGLLILMFISAEVKNTNIDKIEFMHFVPFINMWVTDDRKVNFLSDVFMGNESPEMKKGLMIITNEGLLPQKSSFQSIYKFKKSYRADSTLNEQFAKIEPYSLSYKYENGGIMNLTTYFLYGSENILYLPIQMCSNDMKGFTLSAPIK